MARDPELLRFGGLFARPRDTGQSHTGLPTTDVRIVVPLQHLIQKVLHFVCEFRESSEDFISALVLDRGMDARLRGHDAR
jgi:hypothetical protein